jgi:methylmalonyl-CoA mutase N-terminal domain/subunit
MESLLEEIPLEKVSVSMTINSTAAIMLCMVLAVAKRSGVDWRHLRGTIQNDILKEYIARGTHIFPPEPSLRLTTDLFEFCRDQVPNWNPISISGYHIREAGSTATQEIAFTLANGIVYVQKAIEAGLSVDEFAGQLSFFFNAHNGFLEEIAKYRAARRLWARIMRDRFGALNPKSQSLRFHAQTAGSALTARQPENNIVRVAVQALSAVLGGTQSLHCNSLDEALALPSENAARLALRTQQILAMETGVSQTVDPMGGSYTIERMTDDFEKGAEEYIRRIDAMGGMLRAIESGFVQREIQEAAYQYQRRVESGETVVVGVNRFVTGEDAEIETLIVDESVGERQRASLRRLREEREPQGVARALDELQEAAKSRKNLVPFILRAVEASATTGEISDRLRTVFGEYRESS